MPSSAPKQETPRTDAEAFTVCSEETGWKERKYVDADFARQLERALRQQAGEEVLSGDATLDMAIKSAHEWKGRADDAGFLARQLLRLTDALASRSSAPAPSESAPEELVRRNADLIYEAIKHGDEKHQQWLREKSYEVAESFSRPAADREDARRVTVSVEFVAAAMPFLDGTLAGILPMEHKTLAEQISKASVHGSARTARNLLRQAAALSSEQDKPA